MGQITSSTRHSFLSVEEAAAILRISRSTAYQQANAWLATDGATGIPCVRIGRRILVIAAGIEDMARLGPPTALDDGRPATS